MSSEEVGGRRSEVGGQRALSEAICAKHRDKHGGELSALVGQVITVAVGDFPDKAIMAQEAKVATDAGELFLILTQVSHFKL